MPTHRPSPQHATPRRRPFTAPPLVDSQLVVLSAAAVLANFGWTSAYKPDPFGHKQFRRRDRDDTGSPSGVQEPRNQHGAGETTGSAAAPLGPGLPTNRPSATSRAASGLPDEAAADGDNTSDGSQDSEENDVHGLSQRIGSVAASHVIGVVNEQTATARWFVSAALDGRLGDHHQQAAQTAVTVATEHGFVDDPTRVAEALVVFLHPDHR